MYKHKLNALFNTNKVKYFEKISYKKTIHMYLLLQCS